MLKACAPAGPVEVTQQRTTWERLYQLGLLILTVATGAIDGVSYLALDRVFTGNMTGNVLFIGFGIAGVEDIPLLNNVVALVAFLVGSIAGSRFTRRNDAQLLLPASTLIVLTVGTAATLAVSIGWMIAGTLTPTFMVGVTAVLALVLGAQAAAVRHTGIRDLSTVVVTMTMVNLAADSRVAGGAGASWLRRVAAIVTMGTGALVAAVITVNVSGAVALVTASVVMVAGTITCWVARHRESTHNAGPK